MKSMWKNFPGRKGQEEKGRRKSDQTDAIAGVENGKNKRVADLERPGQNTAGRRNEEVGKELGGGGRKRFGVDGRKWRTAVVLSFFLPGGALAR